MDMNTVFELHRRGLITDEVLAECLNEKYGQKNVEKTWEEKREELIEKNREQAEANRQKISEYEKKYRDEYKMFIVEGEHLVKEAYKNNCLIEVFSLEQSGYENETIITPNVMKKIASLASSPSIIGICKMKDNDIIVGDKILILDNIQDPGNLGTIIRSAVAFNIDTIVLSTDTVSLYNEKTIRATQGMLFYANVITKNLKEFIPLLKNNGYKIYTTNVNNGISIKKFRNTENSKNFTERLGFICRKIMT